MKYFNEDVPQYQILCAGSLLGAALHQGTSFPVGKVEFLDLYPLSYFELLMAMGKEQHVELLKKGDFDMAAAFQQDYIDLLKHYYIEPIGGTAHSASSLLPYSTAAFRFPFEINARRHFRKNRSKSSAWLQIVTET